MNNKKTLQDRVYQLLKDSNNPDGLSDFIADITTIINEKDEIIERLAAWKASAIKVMPDFQEIGKLINAKPGTGVSEQIIPFIRKQQDEIEKLKEEIKEWEDSLPHRALVAKNRELEKERDAQLIKDNGGEL
jgi:hypothetical protein